MTNKTIIALATVVNHNKPFYASELGLNGGITNALATWGFIKPTGNEREEFIPISTWDEGLYKRVEVYEWEVSPRAIPMIQFKMSKLQKELDKLNEAMEILKGLEK